MDVPYKRSNDASSTITMSSPIIGNYGKNLPESEVKQKLTHFARTLIFPEHLNDVYT